jgi:hypothetical protein
MGTGSTEHRRDGREDAGSRSRRPEMRLRPSALPNRGRPGSLLAAGGVVWRDAARGAETQGVWHPAFSPPRAMEARGAFCGRRAPPPTTFQSVTPSAPPAGVSRRKSRNNGAFPVTRTCSRRTASGSRTFLAELLNHKEVRGLLSDEHFSVDGTQVARALNCLPWVRSFAHSPVVVIHLPAEMVAEWPTTVTRSRCPRAFVRTTNVLLQRTVAPLAAKELLAICEGLGDSVRDVRDRALLLVGFAGAFRRSGLVAVNFEDLERAGSRRGHNHPQEQKRPGRPWRLGRIACGHSALRPVQAMERWLAVSGIANGHLGRCTTLRLFMSR